jgi:hypothetical protein
MFSYGNQQSQCQPRMREYLPQVLNRVSSIEKQARTLLDTISVSKLSKHANLRAQIGATYR